MILTALLLASGLGDLSGYPEFAKFGPLPREVRVFIDRRIACNHWSGEYSGDHFAPDPEVRRAQVERDRQVLKAQRDLRCEIVEREERRLQRRHAGSPPILKALDETRDWLP